jgi:hypothetical protein
MGVKKMLQSIVLAKRLFFFTCAFGLIFSGSRSLVEAQISTTRLRPACNSNTPSCHTIKVDGNTNTGGVDDVDTVVKNNDQIEFCPNPAELDFSIIFTKSPFANGKLKFDERDCGKPLKVMLKPNDHARAFTYILAAGNQYFDPHVIIMGSRADDAGTKDSR